MRYQLSRPLLFSTYCAIGLALFSAVKAGGAEETTSTPPIDHEVSLETDQKSSIVPQFLRGYKITVGPSVRELTLDYTRPGADELAGTMTEGMYTTYFIRVGSPYKLSKNKRWGYNFEWEYADFSMTKQNVGSEEKDLGTEVNGYSWYVAPLGFVLWGPVPDGTCEFSLISGIWMGLGYVKAQGDMILTEDGSNEYHKVEQEGFGVAAGLMLEVHYWNLMSRLTFGGSILGDEGATYDAVEMVWDFGYTFTF